MRRLTCVLLLAAACSSDPGAVTLAWSFGDQRLGCDAAGVQTVHVFIGPLQPVGSFDDEVQCEAGEGAGLRARGVAPGRHVVVLKALAHDHVLYTLTKELELTANMDMGRLQLPVYVPAP